MSEVMDHGVIGMPFDMAMRDDLSRRQFYSRAQSILAERDQANATIAELRAEVERLRDKYQRDVFGLNNEGDPIGGEPAGGYANDNARLRAELDALRGKSEWIACAERLPDSVRGVDVLVYRPTAHEMPANDENVTIKRYNNSLGFSGCHKVTHWRPLPAAPSRQD